MEEVLGYQNIQDYHPLIGDVLNRIHKFLKNLNEEGRKHEKGLEIRKHAIYNMLLCLLDRSDKILKKEISIDEHQKFKNRITRFTQYLLESDSLKEKENSDDDPLFGYKERLSVYESSVLDDRQSDMDICFDATQMKVTDLEMKDEKERKIMMAFKLKTIVGKEIDIKDIKFDIDESIIHIVKYYQPDQIFVVMNANQMDLLNELKKAACDLAQIKKEKEFKKEKMKKDKKCLLLEDTLSLIRPQFKDCFTVVLMSTIGVKPLDRNYTLAIIQTLSNSAMSDMNEVFQFSKTQKRNITYLSTIYLFNNLSFSPAKAGGQSEVVRAIKYLKKDVTKDQRNVMLGILDKFPILNHKKEIIEKQKVPISTPKFERSNNDGAPTKTIVVLDKCISSAPMPFFKEDSPMLITIPDDQVMLPTVDLTVPPPTQLSTTTHPQPSTTHPQPSTHTYLQPSTQDHQPQAAKFNDLNKHQVTLSQNYPNFEQRWRESGYYMEYPKRPFNKKFRGRGRGRHGWKPRFRRGRGRGMFTDYSQGYTVPSIQTFFCPKCSRNVQGQEAWNEHGNFCSRTRE